MIVRRNMRLAGGLFAIMVVVLTTAPVVDGDCVSNLTGGDERAAVEGTRGLIRLATAVYYDYEKHTIRHWLIYHWLVGFDEFHIYVDDRPGRNASRDIVTTLQHELRWYPGVTVFSLGKAVGKSTSVTMLAKEYKTAGGEGVRWIHYFDGDEYFVPHQSHRLWMQDNMPCLEERARAWVREVRRTRGAAVERPDLIGFDVGRWYGHVLGANAGAETHLRVILLPRLPFGQLEPRPGELLRVPKPPTESLGQHFWEGTVYPSPVMGTEGHCNWNEDHKCIGKAAYRLGFPLQPGVHSVRDVPSLRETYYATYTSGVDSPTLERALYEIVPNDIHKPQCPKGTYTGPYLAHYQYRSREECLLKARNQANGINAVSKGRGWRARFGDSICSGRPSCPERFAEEGGHMAISQVATIVNLVKGVLEYRQLEELKEETDTNQMPLI